MSLNKLPVQSPRSKVQGRSIWLIAIVAFAVFASACGLRQDMQDQPRYKTYKKSDFFADGRGSRKLPDGTVARGQLFDNKAFYTGKIDSPSTA